jgi:hypothetical protein
VKQLSVGHDIFGFHVTLTKKMEIRKVFETDIGGAFIFGGT